MPPKIEQDILCTHEESIIFWKKKLLNLNFCYRQHHVKDHEFFLNPTIFEKLPAAYVHKQLLLVLLSQK